MGVFSVFQMSKTLKLMGFSGSFGFPISSEEWPRKSAFVLNWKTLSNFW